MDGLCIYKYQLATQGDRGQLHLSQKSDRSVKASLRLKPQSLQRFFRIGTVTDTPSCYNQFTTCFCLWQFRRSPFSISSQNLSRSTAVRGIPCRIAGKRISHKKAIKLVSVSNLSYLGML